MRNEIVRQIEVGVDSRVLDVGCGTGYTTSGVLNRRGVREVVGLDMNPVQLKKAIKNLYSRKAGYRFQEATLRTCLLSDDRFDAVISVGAIEYFPDPERVVKELARVASPNGKIIVGGPESAWFSKFALNRVFYTPSS